MNNIVLCGFMGCGKTTVGIELAHSLNYKFVDMDEYIVYKTGISIADIFLKLGEAQFRVIETEAAAYLSQKDNLVISTGGGAVLKAENVKLFKSGGLIVFIDVPLSIIKERLQGDLTRPLLNRLDRDVAIFELYNQRTPIYIASADIIVKNIQNLSALEMVSEITKNLKHQSHENFLDIL